MNTRHMEIRNQIRLKTFRPEIHFNSHVHIFFLIFLFSPGCFSYCLLRFPILGQIPTGAMNKISTCDAVFMFNMIKSKDCSKIISE